MCPSRSQTSTLLEGLGAQRSRSLGNQGSQGGLLHSFCKDSSFSYISSCLDRVFKRFHKVFGPLLGSQIPSFQGSSGRSAKSPLRRLLQSPFRGSEGPGGWRPILDVSALNLFILKTKFHMETICSVMSSMQQRGWMVTLDMQDAYFHVPVHPDSQKFLRIVFQD